METNGFEAGLVPARTMPTRDKFVDAILPSATPFVFRNAFVDWPLVVAGKAGAERCMSLLVEHMDEFPVEVIRAAPEEEGRFHYTADGKSLNFARGRARTLAVFLDGLRELSAVARPHAMVAQGIVAERYFHGFRASHPMSLVPAASEPRLWIGNAGKVATHNDQVENVAVVAAGRRRFTLFPPAAEDDLYLGPAHPTPAGVRVSMVHVTRPDLARYPRFAEAMKVAQVAELAPGDALFIPRNWFHHVEALERFNILVNYWWDSGATA